METPPRNAYKWLKLTSTPSVKLVEPMEYHEHELNKAIVILILGPTGAGKSTDYIDEGAEILKFDNTRESALSILNHSVRLMFRLFLDFQLRSFMSSGLPLRRTKFAGNIYEGLQTQLGNIHMELANIQTELQEAAERDDEQLTGVLVARLEEAQKMLAMLEQELREFGDPPDPEVSHRGIPGRVTILVMRLHNFLARYIERYIERCLERNRT
ncbi:hypothetical protein BJ165DRAFT_1608741 [Panaeolus papilionaceus]|nr:hypothetical protein BJ165DRAFT_1608741 [Panaeolus papilionaceus]